MTRPVPEAIRLVVWDLDDTFWQGTISEGGIVYSQANHDIVVTLARRGIISSICSNNKRAPVVTTLRERSLFKYFIFADIGWGPKGPRLAALIEKVQLRPQTVLFIDDSALNRAEAEFYVPGLQTASASCLRGLLSDPRLAGKDDSSLSRLRQYRLLQRRHADAQAVGGDNIAFLRASDVRVTIDYDVDARLDRAIELVNRTNQLNFTKRRLSEDVETARRELRQELARYHSFAGLVRVSDRYGDYGDVGFFLSHIAGTGGRLEHFCFSCRILNMGVESWVYRWLGRPRMRRAGPVASDPVRDDRTIDWISHDDGLAAVPRTVAAHRPLARMVLRGGCDMSALAHYLSDLADENFAEFHIARDNRLLRIDHSAFLNLALDGVAPSVAASLEEIGYASEDWTSAVTLPIPEGRPAAWLFSFWIDPFAVLYRHRQFGVAVPFSLPGSDPHVGVDATGLDEAYVRALTVTPSQSTAFEALRRNHIAVGQSDRKALRAVLRKLMQRAGPNILIAILLGPEEWTEQDGGRTHPLPEQAKVNGWIRAEVGGTPNVLLLDPKEYVGDAAARAEPLHFERLFYLRVAQAVRVAITRFIQTGDVRNAAPAPRSHLPRSWRGRLQDLVTRLGSDAT